MVWMIDQTNRVRIIVVRVSRYRVSLMIVLIPTMKPQLQVNVLSIVFSKSYMFNE